MIIDQHILDDLTAQAKASPRLRMNLDLRNSPEDLSQRMLNAVIDMVPGGTLINIPAGQWHSLRSLESGTVLLECKDGKWEPLGEGDVM